MRMPSGTMDLAGGQVMRIGEIGVNECQLSYSVGPLPMLGLAEVGGSPLAICKIGDSVGNSYRSAISTERSIYTIAGVVHAAGGGDGGNKAYRSAEGSN